MEFDVSSKSYVSRSLAIDLVFEYLRKLLLIFKSLSSLTKNISLLFSVLIFTEISHAVRGTRNFLHLCFQSFAALLL